MVRSFLRSLCVTTITLSVAGFASLEHGNAASYQEKLSAYRAAYSVFQAKTDRYWAEIARKKDIRTQRRKAGKPFKRKHFVLVQPPKYTGPKRPKNPNVTPSTAKKKKKRSTLPRADDLRAAMREIYGVKLPKYKERDYKYSYALESRRNGLTAEQVIGVYALETGGLGPYDRVSGEIPRMSGKCTVKSYVGRPLSTALGYFQLLNANTSSTVHGNMKGPEAKRFSTRLRALAKQNRGKRKRALKAKAKLLEVINADMKKYIARYSGRKNNWAEFRALGRTKLGYAIHALNLDIDIGPMIQVSKLAFVRDYAIKKGLGNVASDRLELMNLVGYPRGAKMLEGEAFHVPTANFVKANELKANYSVLGDKTVEQSVAKIRRIIGKRKQECGSQEFFKMWKKAS
ncbi:MAG: hypothetical protein ABJK39_01500 [Hyphomicrobiales bacterium]